MASNSKKTKAKRDRRNAKMAKKRFKRVALKLKKERAGTPLF